jgi:hypothetical protein
MWMMCGYTRQRQGTGDTGAELNWLCRDQRSTTKYGATTRSSPAPKRDCFRVLKGRDERGEGMGYFTSRLGLSQVRILQLNEEIRVEMRVSTACSIMAQQDRNKKKGVKATAWIGNQVRLRL